MPSQDDTEDEWRLFIIKSALPIIRYEMDAINFGEIYVSVLHANPLFTFMSDQTIPSMRSSREHP
ncbi:hypothetical protein SISNIDRAFT_453890 [Sistotremastrum niveocremeum HHB9708]|uniref:Uncharacterized protein n=1 Tax=Sistotremastrum niveocremeum HHB9708 TaxID=1314777 RepID=A0A164VHN0_9AGAM|nr:hypothetical protein SISNIDRAFT_453890 [Sistotremastrum niveocremeum HHB9708]